MKLSDKLRAASPVMQCIRNKLTKYGMLHYNGEQKHAKKELANNFTSVEIFQTGTL